MHFYGIRSSRRKDLIHILLQKCKTPSLLLTGLCSWVAKADFVLTTNILQIKSLNTDPSEALCIFWNRQHNAQCRFGLENYFCGWVYVALKESCHFLSLYPCRSLPKKVSLFFLQNYLFFLTQRRVLCHCFLYNVDGFRVEWVLGFS